MDTTSKLTVVALACLTTLASGCHNTQRVAASTLPSVLDHVQGGSTVSAVMVGGERVRLGRRATATVHEELSAYDLGSLVIDDGASLTPRHLRLADVDHVELRRPDAMLNDAWVAVGVVGVLIGAALLIGGLALAASGGLDLGGHGFGSGWAF